MSNNVIVNGKPLKNILTDSFSAFSNVQGQDNWRYGYRNGEGEFKELPYFDGSWRVEPGGCPSIGAAKMHPAIIDGTPVSVIRRWTSDTSGSLQINGSITRPASDGDGVKALIYVDGVETWALDITDRITHDFSVLIPDVHQGSSIDFVISPKISQDGDETWWAIKITR
jgi:hypothetical protein